MCAYLLFLNWFEQRFPLHNDLLQLLFNRSLKKRRRRRRIIRKYLRLLDAQGKQGNKVMSLSLYVMLKLLVPLRVV